MPYITGMASSDDDYLIRPDPIDPRLTERLLGRYRRLDCGAGLVDAAHALGQARIVRIGANDEIVAGSHVVNVSDGADR